MPRYEVRNRRSLMVLGEVVAERPDEVLDALLDATGSTMEDLALSLGGTMEEIRAALDIVEVRPAELMSNNRGACCLLAKAMPARRRLLYQDEK